MFLKLALLVTLLAVCGAQGEVQQTILGWFLSQPGSKDLEYGSRAEEDRVLTQFDIDVPAVLLKKTEFTLRYPPADVNTNETINHIRVTDRIRNGHNGTPTLTNGGVGQKTATIKFVSEINRPMSFSVLITGN